MRRGEICIDRDYLLFTIAPLAGRTILRGDPTKLRTFSPLRKDELQRLFFNEVGVPTAAEDYNALLQSCRFLALRFLDQHRTKSVDSVCPSTYTDVLPPFEPRRPIMSTKKSTPVPSEPTIGATPRVAGATLPTTTAAAKAPKPPKEEKPKVERDKKNGVTRPSSGTTTGLVWDTADKISAKTGAPATREQVAEALGDSMNSSTLATQYGKWRRYYGLPRIRKMPEAVEAEGTSVEAEASEAPEDSGEDKDEGETTVEDEQA